MTGEQILILVLSVYGGAISVLCWRQDEKIHQLEQYVRVVDKAVSKRLELIEAYDPDD